MPGLHWSPRAPPWQRNLQTFITPCLRRPEGFKQHLYMPLYGRERKGLRSVTALIDRDVGFRGFAYGYGNEDEQKEEEVCGYASRVDRNGHVRVCKRSTFVLASEKEEAITVVGVILWRIPPDATTPGLEDGAGKQELFRHTWRLEIKASRQCELPIFGKVIALTYDTPIELFQVTTSLGRQHTWLDGKKHLAGMEKSTQIFRGCSAEGGSPVAVAFLAAFDVSRPFLCLPVLAPVLSPVEALEERRWGVWNVETDKRVWYDRFLAAVGLTDSESNSQTPLPSSNDCLHIHPSISCKQYVALDKRY